MQEKFVIQGLVKIVNTTNINIIEDGNSGE